ncbi:glycosyltransferase family 87 protein [Caballeronia humi]|uniref:Polyprenol-phosphate-mannose-dependent alpha-(1-2)-phosphatidylinositol mannoside mannosyltransferase n=1 Tax=Caballeronia humi TaxID=326474 RepID=A0A158H3K0_9BURK|nr:glycosyltransferase family 87 protein [Caballeronia humi]SAL38888.1 hypothetical protein AWB65_02893 [Caballeronia humi]
MKTASIGSKSTARYSTFGAVLLVIALCMLAARIPHLVRDLHDRGPDWVGDFQYFYYAFTVAINHPSEAWILYDGDHVIPFLHEIGMLDVSAINFYGYPPQFAIIFSWLASWDVSTARIIWSGMSAVCMVTAVILTLQLSYRGGNRGAFVLLAAIVILFRPTLDEMYWGQSNALLFVLLAATFFCIERGNRYAAGLFLALAIAVKVTPMAIVGLLLLRREWRTVISTIIFSVVIAAVTAAQFGWNVILRYYIADLWRLNKQFSLLGGAPFNSSLKGALQTLSAASGTSMSPTALGAISTVFGLAVCLLAAYLVFKRHADPRIDYALATATMLLASPALESVHMVVVLIPLLILVGTTLEEPQAFSGAASGSRTELVFIALSIALLMFSPKFVSYTVAVMLIYGLCVARYFPTAVFSDRGRKTA